jgi:class I fructose-bisphosphate aldolase
MVGQLLRLNRLFSEGRRAVVVALDYRHPSAAVPPSIDVPALVAELCDADAIVLAPGMLRHCGHVFDFRGGPLAIVRLTWSTAYCSGDEYSGTASAQLLSVGAAQAMGADMVLASLNLTASDASADRDSVATLSHVAAEARSCGMPMIAEIWPVGTANLVSDQRVRRVHSGCQMAAELGAGVVAGAFTGAMFGNLVKNCPAPVLATAQNPTMRPLDVLALAYQAIKAGARGVMLGTEVTAASNPAALVKALNRVVKQEADPEAAASEFGVR